jgi:Cupin superfamily protein
LASPADFGKIFQPLTFDQFVDEYWEAQTLYLEGRDPTQYHGLIGLNEFDDFLSRGDIRHPSVRLAKDGAEIPLERYTRELRIGGHSSHDLIDNDRLFAEYSGGATIVLQQLQQNIPGFGILTNDLEKMLDCNVHASAFITPPNAQGFTAHYDTYSFIALQLFGSKKWNIYDRTTLPPIRDDRAADQPWSRVKPSRQLTMKPGDLLYLPRGTFHDAETSEEASIHMTIGFFSANLIDVIKSALTAPELQQALRPSIAIDLSADDLHDASKETVNALNIANGIRKLRAYYASRRVDTRTGRLLDSLSEISWDRETRFRKHPSLDFAVNEDRQNQRFTVNFLGKNISLPLAALPTFSRIAESSGFQISEVSGPSNYESVRTLCNRLVREGFLTVVR